MALPLIGAAAAGLKGLLTSKAGLAATVGINALPFLPMLGGAKGAGTRAAAKNAIANIKEKGSLNNLAKQLGIEGATKKKAPALREEILEMMMKQEFPTNTRLGTIAGTGRASAATRGTGYGLGAFGAFSALTGADGTGDAGNATMEELLGLTQPGMEEQSAFMEQDIARLNIAQGVGQALTNSRAGIDAALQQLLSPADLNNISSAATADTISHLCKDVASVRLTGSPQA